MTSRFFAPAFELLVKGAPVNEAVARRITEISVTTEPGTLDTFRLVLANPPPKFPFTHGPLSGVLEPGADVEIRMGYVDKLSKLFAGEVTNVGCSFPETGLATVMVSGHTRLHHLRGSAKTRTFLKMSDHDIAEKILREVPSASLTLDADATPGEHEYVIQYNQTDLAFLLERASLIGFSVWVDDKKLHFKKATPAEAAVQTLVWGQPADAFAPGDHLPLGSFTPTMNTLRPVTKVTVQGYDQKKAEPFEASAPEAQAATGGESAADVAAGSGRDVETVVVDRPLQSEAEARRLAQALYDRAALEFITGTGATIGSPDIRAGRLVKLEGLGPVFNGTYSVTQSTHTISGSGYRTTFAARKAAVG